jgi:hypothetical protein
VQARSVRAEPDAPAHGRHGAVDIYRDRSVPPQAPPPCGIRITLRRTRHRWTNANRRGHAGPRQRGDGHGVGRRRECVHGGSGRTFGPRAQMDAQIAGPGSCAWSHLPPPDSTDFWVIRTESPPGAPDLPNNHGLCLLPEPQSHVRPLRRARRRPSRLTARARRRRRNRPRTRSPQAPKLDQP